MDVSGTIRDRSVKAAVDIALSGLRITPDTVLTSASDRLLRNVGHPQGKEFLKTALLLSKRRLPEMAPSVRKSILNFIANVYF